MDIPAIFTPVPKLIPSTNESPTVSPVLCKLLVPVLKLVAVETPEMFK